MLLARVIVLKVLLAMVSTMSMFSMPFLRRTVASRARSRER
jgi:hypothetical protein